MVLGKAKVAPQSCSRAGEILWEHKHLLVGVVWAGKRCGGFL